MPIQKLIDTLSLLCPKVIEQGSMARDEQYPVRLFTFWNPETRDTKHYDNTANCVEWVVDVNFYSTDHADVYATLSEAIAALRAAGWTISGEGHAVVSDHATHTGRGFTAVYPEYQRGVQR